METGELQKRFERIRVWAQKGERAPHKPLLLLWALGRLQAGKPRLVPFMEIEEPLRNLLREFGPPRKSYHPEFPFWHLQTDHLWEIPGMETLPRRRGSSNVTAKNLREGGIAGGFPVEVFTALRNDPVLLGTLARRILQGSFPESYHDDLLSAVGLELPVSGVEMETRTLRIRDPEFRERILRAYGQECCVCGISLRLGSALVGIEAAHIKWHQAGGPDMEANGLCLCTLHHKLFDRGVWGFDESRRILVSEDAAGPGAEDWLYRFQHQVLRPPRRTDYLPRDVFRNWHVAEVLRHPFS